MERCNECRLVGVFVSTRIIVWRVSFKSVSRRADFASIVESEIIAGRYIGRIRAGNLFARSCARNLANDFFFCARARARMCACVCARARARRRQVTRARMSIPRRKCCLLNCALSYRWLNCTFTEGFNVYASEIEMPAFNNLRNAWR